MMKFPQTSPQAKWSNARLYSSAAIILIFTIAFTSLYWWHLISNHKELRARTAAQTEQRAKLLVEAVAGQTNILVHYVDFALQHLCDDFLKSDRKAFSVNVDTISRTFPPGAAPSVSVIDADGYVVYTSLATTAANIFAGDREHFKSHADAEGAHLIISKPLVGRVSGKWSIYFTRPLIKNGRFAGIVSLALSPEYIASNLDIPGLGKRDVITLFDGDGNFMSRSHDLAGVLGKSVPKDRPFVGKQAPVTGAYRAIASYDNVKRTFAWRRTEVYPLIALVGIDETEVFAPIDAEIDLESIANGLGTVVVLFLVGGIIALLIRIVRSQQALSESEEMYRTVFSSASEGIMVTDAQNRILAVNPAFTQITGYAMADIFGHDPKVLASGQHDASFYHRMWQQLLTHGAWEGELVNRRKDGLHYDEMLKITLIRDDKNLPHRYVAMCNDITEKKRREEIVWQQANYDSLTGLPNRQLLEDRLDRAISHAFRQKSQMAILFIDLDRFKPVNDTWGHAVGDNLLCQVARRLKNVLRDEDTVARIGGDEFVVLMPTIEKSDAPVCTAEKVISVLSEPFRVDEQILDISCSIGIAVFPSDADNALQLIKMADIAMYAAKDAGRSTWKRQ